jgi:hypothetical protein
VINSLRYELHDTGELPYRAKPKPPCGCEEGREPAAGALKSSGK